MKTNYHHGLNKWLFMLCLGCKGRLISNHFLDDEAMKNDFHSQWCKKFFSI